MDGAEGFACSLRECLTTEQSWIGHGIGVLLASVSLAAATVAE